MNTPKTDAATGEHSTFHGVQMVSADFARHLETQVQELTAALQRGMELCERGHGHEWADEARAILEKTK